MSHIHSIVPDGKIEKLRGARRGIVITFLRNEMVKHCGYEKAITSDELHDILKRDHGIDSGKQRNLIREGLKILLNDYNLPILSCVNGYYWAVKDEEYDDCIDTEEKRIQGILRNIEKIRYLKTTKPMPTTASEGLFD